LKSLNFAQVQGKLKFDGFVKSLKIGIFQRITHCFYYIQNLGNDFLRVCQAKLGKEERRRKIHKKIADYNGFWGG
jgi:hypothetical protein